MPVEGYKSITIKDEADKKLLAIAKKKKQSKAKTAEAMIDEEHKKITQK